MRRIKPATIARWFEQYARPLVLYARQWIGGACAEDLVQDVFTRLMRQTNHPDDVQAWLYRSTRNAAIDQLRVRRRRRARETQSAQHCEAWFETRPADLIDADTVCRQLEALPNDLREIVVLRIWAQLTFAQIGEIVGVSPATAMRRYENALQQIRQRLEKSCPSQPTP